MRIEFFDENRELVKTFQGFDYHSVEEDGPYMRPRRAVMTHRLKDSTSVMALQRSRLNVPFEASWFTLKGVKNWDQSRDEAVRALFETSADN